MSRDKVLVARMHETSFVNGLGELKRTLDNNTYKGIKMELVNDHMLYVWHKNKFLKIPATNFENFEIEHAEEQTAKPLTKAKAS
jgi:hypothetical protein